MPPGQLNETRMRNACMAGECPYRYVIESPYLTSDELCDPLKKDILFKIASLLLCLTRKPLANYDAGQFSSWVSCGIQLLKRLDVILPSHLS